MIRPSTVAAIMKVTKLFAVTPGEIRVAIPSPVTVASQTINRSVITTAPKT